MKLTPALLIPLLLAPAGCAARRGPAGIPESAQYAELDLLRPFPGADKIYVQADLPGGETGIFLVDTGASTSLLTDEMAERLGVVGQPTDGVLAGLGGRVQLVEGRLPWVSLGGVVVGDVAVAVGTPSLGPFSAQIPLDGILGNNVWGTSRWRSTTRRTSSSWGCRARSRSPRAPSACPSTASTCWSP
jgi:hypothetical protein